jgi:ribosomal protein L11 methyltransferase
MAAWVEVRARVARPRAELLSEAMLDAGALGLQEDLVPGSSPVYRQPWDTGPPPPEPAELLLRGWWPEEGFEDAWPALSRRLAERGGTEVHWVRVEDEDWAQGWRAAFTRVELGPGLAVAPPWLAQEGDLVIDPGMAFGTGEHTTTRACLSAVLRLARPGGSCLDVGTGSGVVAVLAARQGMRARGIDIDPVAIVDARGNALRNGVEVALDTTPLAQVQGRFELVVANIFAEVLVQMAPDLARLCAGHLVLAGILADRSERVEQAMSAQGLRVEERLQDGEWVSYVWSSPERGP